MIKVSQMSEFVTVYLEYRERAAPELLLFTTSSEHAANRSTRLEKVLLAMAAVAAALVENETEIHSALTAKDWQ